MIFLLLCLASALAKQKISEVYALLPQTQHIPGTRTVRFTLQAYDGCYRWTTSDSKVVSIQPSPGGVLLLDESGEHPSIRSAFEGEVRDQTCFPSVVLEPVAKVESPPITLISAVDFSNPQSELKCEVKVGRIARLEILSSVRSFRVQDYLRLTAQAFDSDNNVFSTLEGLRFRWQIEKGSDVLGLPKLKDSLVLASSVRSEIENSNYHSDILLVEGKHSGKAEVSLKIVEPGYEHVELARIYLSISEPFAIAPSTQVFVLPQAVLQFSLFRVTEKKYYNLATLPDSDFIWTSGAPSLFTVTSAGLASSLNSRGKGILKVQDKQIEDNSLECEVNVVAPNALRISIRPGDLPSVPLGRLSTQEYAELVRDKDLAPSNWHLVEGRKYTIEMRLFWNEKEVIVPSNALFDAVYERPEAWTIVTSDPNNARVVVIPRMPDHKYDTLRTEIRAELTRVISKSLDLKDWVPSPAIVDSQEAIITKQLVIEEPGILLPYFAVLSPFPDYKNHYAQEYYVKFSGGSGVTSWSSSNVKGVYANAGVVHALRVGKTSVTVTDSNNPLNYATVEVEVAPVAELKWTEPRREVVQNHVGFVEVVAVTAEGRNFHNCTRIVLDWEVSATPVLQLTKALPVTNQIRGRGVCEIREFQTLREGQTSVKAHLNHRALGLEELFVEVSSSEGRVGVFQPLSIGLNEKVDIFGNSVTVSQLTSQQAVVLTPGTTASFPLVGGPLPWDDLVHLHSGVAESAEPHVKVTYQPIGAKNKNSLELKCDAAAEQRDYQVTLSVGTLANAKLVSPGKSKLSLTVACLYPFSLKLHWSEALTDVNWRSKPQLSSAFRHRIASSFGNFWIALNSQELKVKVTARDERLREFYLWDSVPLKWSVSDNTLFDFKSHKDNQLAERAVTLHDLEGPVRVTAEVQRNGQKVSDELQVELVKNVAIWPPQYSLYMHQANSKEFEIQYGSGVFEVSCNTTDLAKVTYDGGRKVRVTPISPGKVHITVVDAGLKGSNPAQAVVLVSYVAGLDLQRGGLLALGSYIDLSLAVLDSEGSAFDAKELKFMQLDLHFHSPAAFRIQDRSSTTDTWKLKGLEVGEFPVYASAKIEEGRALSSNSVAIDVFPPLQIVPPVVLMMPGSQLTLSYRGGPDVHKHSQYQITTQWRIVDVDVATIDSASALVSAVKLGSSAVELVMYRGKEVLARTEGRLKVDLPNELAVVGLYPGRALLVGSAVRLIAEFRVNGEVFTKTVWRSTFTWSSNSPTVFEIYHENDSISRQVAVTGLAHIPGLSEVTLFAELQLPQEYSKERRSFTAKGTAKVEEGLHGLTPDHRCHYFSDYECKRPGLDSTVLMIPPHASLSIKLNKEVPVTLRCESCREEFLKLDPSGRLTSYGQLGSASVFLQNSRVRADFNLLDVVVAEVAAVFVDRSHLAMNVPLGAEYFFNVTYQDMMAHSFASDLHFGINTALEVSDSRVVHAVLEKSNSTLHLRTQYVGSTLVKVYLIDRPEVYDLFQVTVSSVMKPMSPLHLNLGGEATFQTTHIVPAGERGHWAVDNPHILSINNQGMVKGISEGDAQVIYTEKGMELKSSVSVSRVQLIEVSPEGPSEVSNYEQHSSFRTVYKLPLLMYFDKQRNRPVPRLSDEDRTLVRQNIKVTCSSPAHSKWFHVESEQALAQRTGLGNQESMGCVLTPITSLTVPEKAERVLRVVVRVTSRDSALYVYEETVNLRFVPKFAVLETDGQLILSGSQTERTLSLSGACDSVEANSYSSGVLVEKHETDAACSLKVVVLPSEGEVRLRKVELVDKLTQQKELLLVSYYKDPSAAERSGVISFHDVLIVIVIAALAYILLYQMKAPRQLAQPHPVPSGLHSAQRNPRVRSPMMPTPAVRQDDQFGRSSSNQKAQSYAAFN
jgi:nuclear pore complex protein Nup210